MRKNGQVDVYSKAVKFFNSDILSKIYYGNIVFQKYRQFWL